MPRSPVQTFLNGSRSEEMEKLQELIQSRRLTAKMTLVTYQFMLQMTRITEANSTWKKRSAATRPAPVRDMEESI